MEIENAVDFEGPTTERLREIGDGPGGDDVGSASVPHLVATGSAIDFDDVSVLRAEQFTAEVQHPFDPFVDRRVRVGDDALDPPAVLLDSFEPPFAPFELRDIRVVFDAAAGVDPGLDRGAPVFEPALGAVRTGGNAALEAVDARVRPVCRQEAVGGVRRPVDDVSDRPGERVDVGSDE